MKNQLNNNSHVELNQISKSAEPHSGRISSLPKKSECMQSERMELNENLVKQNENESFMEKKKNQSNLDKHHSVKEIDPEIVKPKVNENFLISQALDFFDFPEPEEETEGLLEDQFFKRKNEEEEEENENESENESKSKDKQQYSIMKSGIESDDTGYKEESGYAPLTFNYFDDDESTDTEQLLQHDGSDNGEVINKTVTVLNEDNFEKQELDSSMTDPTLSDDDGIIEIVFYHHFINLLYFICQAGFFNC